MRGFCSDYFVPWDFNFYNIVRGQKKKIVLFIPLIYTGGYGSEENKQNVFNFHLRRKCCQNNIKDNLFAVDEKNQNVLKKKTPVFIRNFFHGTGDNKIQLLAGGEKLLKISAACRLDIHSKFEL